MEKKIITIGEILRTRLADTEDLFTLADYLTIYNKAFSDKIEASEVAGSDPIVSRIARLKGLRDFDHGKPADYFLRKRDEILPTLSEETLTNFERLFERINSTLE